MYSVLLSCLFNLFNLEQFLSLHSLWHWHIGRIRRGFKMSLRRVFPGFLIVHWSYTARQEGRRPTWWCVLLRVLHTVCCPSVLLLGMLALASWLAWFYHASLLYKNYMCSMGRWWRPWTSPVPQQTLTGFSIHFDVPLR